jgi:hypothetical protein
MNYLGAVSAYLILIVLIESWACIFQRLLGFQAFQRSAEEHHVALHVEASRVNLASDVLSTNFHCSNVSTYLVEAATAVRMISEAMISFKYPSMSSSP